MRASLVACSLLLLAGCAGVAKKAEAPDFNFHRYVPTALAEAEKPADGICSNDLRPTYMLDMALTPMRLRVSASQRFRPLPKDAELILAHYNKAAQVTNAPRYDEEVLVRIDGQERWLPIQAQVAPFWRQELTEGQELWLYTTRVGCLIATAPTGDRAILSINEFQIEPIGQPEPTP